MFPRQHSDSKMKLLYFVVILGILFATTAMVEGNGCKYLLSTNFTEMIN